MRDFVKWASGTALRRNETVGPRHDPYSREIVEVVIHGEKTVFVSCGLAGDYFYGADGQEVRFDSAASEDYDAACVSLTGHTHWFWMDRLWDKVNAARYRLDPKGWELQQQMDYCDGYYGHM